MNVKIGDKLMLPYHSYMDKCNYYEGTVIGLYKRFFRVEFDINGNKVRESYSYYGPLE